MGVVLLLAASLGCGRVPEDELESLRVLLARDEHAALLQALDRRSAVAPAVERSERQRLRTLALAGLGRAAEAVDALQADGVQSGPHCLRVAALLLERQAIPEAIEVVRIGAGWAPEDRERFEALGAQIEQRARESSILSEHDACGGIVDSHIGYVGGGKPCVLVLTFADGCTVEL